MANHTVATLSLSSNDIYSLAQIFHTTLHYYCTVINPSQPEYLRDLSTLVGLGFTAILTDGDLLCVYEPYLQTYIRFRKFREHSAYLQMFARAIAEILGGATLVFSSVKYPVYFEEFIRLINKTLNHLYAGGTLEERKRLLQQLTQKKRISLFD